MHTTPTTSPAPVMLLIQRARRRQRYHDLLTREGYGVVSRLAAHRGPLAGLTARPPAAVMVGLRFAEQLAARDDHDEVAAVLPARSPVIAVDPPDDPAALADLERGLGVRFTDVIAEPLGRERMLHRLQVQIRWAQARRRLRRACLAPADLDPTTELPGPESMLARLAEMGPGQLATAGVLIRVVGVAGGAATVAGRRLLRLVTALAGEALAGYDWRRAFAGALPPDGLLLLVPGSEASLVKESLRSRFAREARALTSGDSGAARVAASEARLELATVPLHDVRGRPGDGRTAVAPAEVSTMWRGDASA